MTGLQSISIVLCFILMISSMVVAGGNSVTKEFVYVGTFSERGSEGIYVYEVFRDNLHFELRQTIVSKGSPSFIVISPDGKYLFSANRKGMDEDDSFGSITSFAINPETGILRKIQDYSSYGQSPCHISVHPTGKYLFVSHYAGGNVVVFPVVGSGNIGEPTQSIQYDGSSIILPQQSQPHPHSAIPDHEGKFVYISDLGQDKILIYRFNMVEGQLKSAENPYIQTLPGSGPRHFTFHPNGSIAFSAEEISSSISSYKVDSDNGNLSLVQRLTALPKNYSGKNSCADIHTTPDGKYVYISNRGYDGLAIFRINEKGKMKNIGYMPTVGQQPRNFMLEPNGKFMLVGNRASDEINIFTIERHGTLKYTNAYLSVPSNSCIKLLKLK